MSRIGRNPITSPEGVTVAINGRLVTVKGPKGELSYEHRPEMKVEVKQSFIVVSVVKETKESSAYWGLTRALINNMVVGVTEGYEKKLELVGVGYRVKSVDKQKITLTVGYSHPVEFIAPEGIAIESENNKELVIWYFGIK